MLNAFCINLSNRTDRWKYMQSVAKRAYFNLVRVDAVDGSLPENSQKLNEMKKHGPVGVIGKGALACTLSHAKAWETFLATDLEFGLFLEDDVVVSDDFTEAVTGFISKKPPFDLIKIECGGSAKSGLLLGEVVQECKNRRLRACHQLATDAAGYIMSRKGAEEALLKLPDCNVGVDHYLFYPRPRIGGASIPFAVIEPSLVIQDRGMNSNISSSRHEDSLWERRIKRAGYEVAPAPYMILKLFSGARVIKAPFRK